MPVGPGEYTPDGCRMAILPTTLTTFLEQVLEVLRSEPEREDYRELLAIASQRALDTALAGEPAQAGAYLATRPPTPTISTEELATAVGVTPGTIRTQLCRTGSYFGLRPAKLPNGRLRWTADAAEQLLAGGSADPLDAPPAGSKRRRRPPVPRATPIIDADAGEGDR